MALGEDPLGPDYHARELPLRNDQVATLVRRAAPANSAGAVLYIHGYVDYFFHPHVADYFVGRGYDFYAVDLRRSGRSIRPGDIPFYFEDLKEFDEELDASVEQIRSDGHQRLTVLGHSTGGLIAALWLSRRGDSLPVEALILNSPWLDLQEPWFVRTVGTQFLQLVGQVAPTYVLPQGISPAYGQSLHADHHGEWSFDTEWKPVSGAPTYAGAVAAVRRGHARVHRGLGLRMPVLVLHSDKSRLGLRRWEPGAQDADCVLDVKQMTRWAPKLGVDVTDITIPDAVHDLFLSSPQVREQVFDEIDVWLEQLPSRRRT